MAGVSRKGWIFTAGLLAGGVLTLVLFWFAQEGSWWQRAGFPGSREMHAVSQQPRAEQPQKPPEVGHSTSGPDPTATATATATAPAFRCAYEPLVAPSGPGDGQFVLNDALLNRQQLAPAAFVAVAKEMAEEMRRRDAEIALIVACRVAGKASSSPTVALADVQAQLGQHYLESASNESSSGAKAGLLARAHKLLADSLGAYTAILGQNAAKTRLASRRLAALPPAGSTIDDPHSEAELRELQPYGSTATLGAAMQSPPLDAASETDVAVGCENQRSAALKIICSEPELAQLDSDLGRLRAQAASLTSDPEGLRRRHEQAQARRDSQCRDKACLIRWYAQRRIELIKEF